MKRSITVCLAAILAGISSANADLIIDDSQGLALDVTSWVGEGENTSYFVVDFEATGGTSYAFGYQWSGTETVLDMINSLSAETVFEAEMTSFGDFGTFIDNFSFMSESGDPDNYWAHSLATPTGSGIIDWTAAGGGVESEFLSDGLISGWYNGFNEDFSVINPSLPLIQVPAPAGLSVIGLVLIGSRRRRVR
ncbi:MAG: hypothetical protein CMJ40_10530 [Phycisphaerae bacterium]|nr:hypothetical protein [Phycisphaerae bacterium]